MNLESIVQHIMTKIDDLLSNPNSTSSDTEKTLHSFFRFHSYIKSLEFDRNGELNSVLSKYPTFLCRVADLISSSSHIMNQQGFCGFAFVLQTLLDKDVPPELVILSPNHPIKLALRNFLTQNKNSFFDMDSKEKLKFCTVWEVYADLYPKDDEIVMLLENIGYYD